MSAYHFTDEERKLVARLKETLNATDFQQVMLLFIKLYAEPK